MRSLKMSKEMLYLLFHHIVSAKEERKQPIFTPKNSACIETQMWLLCDYPLKLYLNTRNYNESAAFWDTHT